MAGDIHAELDTLALRIERSIVENERMLDELRQAEPFGVGSTTTEVDTEELFG
ncbi:hypothetical protein [Halobellus litoreus]|uniref:Transposase n=1 Tax=Halobellus litoreus TaxID=755310 RepID=A0ABD6DU00_9EURY|nr:hypothetical protein [Halobellus litoreus]